jgi:ppGpp synthetase/RelA/SpoT-type nucleotidyltranferase
MNRKYLNLNNFDTIIDSAGDLEYSMEESFQYANQCNAIRFDSVQSRINRVTEIFKKYRKPGVKL